METRNHSYENLELILPQEVEFIRSATGNEVFTGYAAVFFDPKNAEATQYRPSPNLIERIDRRAFDETDLSDVELWFEHNKTFCMGETRTKSLFLGIDNKGLNFNCPYDAADPDHARAVAKINKKRVNGASIRFKGDCTLHKEGNTWIRTIKKITTIPEFSLVKDPAYSACVVACRSREVDEMNRTQERVERAIIILQKIRNSKHK